MEREIDKLGRSNLSGIAVLKLWNFFGNKDLLLWKVRSVTARRRRARKVARVSERSQPPLFARLRSFHSPNPWRLSLHAFGVELAGEAGDYRSGASTARAFGDMLAIRSARVAVMT
jgi:hypothetical protein